MWHDIYTQVWVLAAFYMVLVVLAYHAGKWRRRTRKPERVRYGLKVKQGARGKWRFAIASPARKTVAISIASGFETEEEARRIGEHLAHG